MSLAYRNMIALEAKSGRGLLRGGGRSAPNRSSVLATASRGYFRMRSNHLSKVTTRRGSHLGRVHEVVGKLERMKRTHPKKVNRVLAASTLAGGGGAYAKRRQAQKRYGSASRALDRTQRGLRHFGG